MLVDNMFKSLKRASYNYCVLCLRTREHRTISVSRNLPLLLKTLDSNGLTWQWKNTKNLSAQVCFICERRLGNALRTIEMVKFGMRFFKLMQNYMDNNFGYQLALIKNQCEKDIKRIVTMTQLTETPIVGYAASNGLPLYCWTEQPKKKHTHDYFSYTNSEATTSNSTRICSVNRVTPIPNTNIPNPNTILQKTNPIMQNTNSAAITKNPVMLNPSITASNLSPLLINSNRSGNLMFLNNSSINMSNATPILIQSYPVTQTANPSNSSINNKTQKPIQKAQSTKFMNQKQKNLTQKALSRNAKKQNPLDPIRIAPKPYPIESINLLKDTDQVDSDVEIKIESDSSDSDIEIANNAENIDTRTEVHEFLKEMEHIVPEEESILPDLPNAALNSDATNNSSLKVEQDQNESEENPLSNKSVKSVYKTIAQDDQSRTLACLLTNGDMVFCPIVNYEGKDYVPSLECAFENGSLTPANVDWNKVLSARNSDVNLPWPSEDFVKNINKSLSTIASSVTNLPTAPQRNLIQPSSQIDSVNMNLTMLNNALHVVPMPVNVLNQYSQPQMGNMLRNELLKQTAENEIANLDPLSTNLVPQTFVPINPNFISASQQNLGQNVIIIDPGQLDNSGTLMATQMSSFQSGQDFGVSCNVNERIYEIKGPINIGQKMPLGNCGKRKMQDAKAKFRLKEPRLVLKRLTDEEIRRYSRPNNFQKTTEMRCYRSGVVLNNTLENKRQISNRAQDIELRNTTANVYSISHVNSAARNSRQICVDVEKNETASVASKKPKRNEVANKRLSDYSSFQLNSGNSSKIAGDAGKRGATASVASKQPKMKDHTIDWEDKIPMDVITYMDGMDPNAPQTFNNPSENEPEDNLGVITSFVGADDVICLD